MEWSFASSNAVAHAAWLAFTAGTVASSVSGTTWAPTVINGSVTGSAQDNFMYRDQDGIRSLMLDDDGCDCHSTLSMGHAMCGSTCSSSYGNCGISGGVDKLSDAVVTGTEGSGTSCTGPATDYGLTLYYYGEPTQQSAYSLGTASWPKYATRSGTSYTSLWSSLNAGDMSWEIFYKISATAAGDVNSNTAIMSSYGDNHNTNTYSSSGRRRCLATHILQAGTVNLCQCGGSCSSSSQSIADDNWHHVITTASRSTNTAYVYVDGSQWASISLVSGDLALDGQIALGAGHSSRGAASSVYGFAIYNRSISSTEIASGQCVSGSEPVTSYALDGDLTESSGQTSYMSIGGSGGSYATQSGLQACASR
jgi:hypothetical protein